MFKGVEIFILLLLTTENAEELALYVLFRAFCGLEGALYTNPTLIKFWI